MGAPGTSSGPWVYRDSLVVRDERGAEIAHVIGYRSGPEPEVLFANARQIAASPDLYDVIEAFLEVFDPAGLVESDLPDSRYAEVARAAYAALAKARGES